MILTALDIGGLQVHNPVLNTMITVMREMKMELTYQKIGSTKTKLEYPVGLEDFLLNWEAEYEKCIKKIDLFDRQKISQWGLRQKKYL